MKQKYILFSKSNRNRYTAMESYGRSGSRSRSVWIFRRQQWRRRRRRTAELRWSCGGAGSFCVWRPAETAETPFQSNCKPKAVELWRLAAESREDSGGREKYDGGKRLASAGAVGGGSSAGNRPNEATNGGGGLAWAAAERKKNVEEFSSAFRSLFILVVF